MQLIISDACVGLVDAAAEVFPDARWQPSTPNLQLVDQVLGERRMVIIELDGHEFHERTKEQVASRNARDRAVQRVGYTIRHFAGSEVNRDPIGCVEEAWRTAQHRRLHKLPGGSE